MTAPKAKVALFATPNLTFWAAIGVVCLIAVGAGLFLPQLLPGTPPTPVLSIPKEQADKNKLVYNAQPWPEAPNTQSMFLRLGLGTALVLALCAATLIVSKRWLRGSPAKETAGGAMQLIDSLALGNRCALHLVSLAGRQVLVGTDASGIKTTVCLTEPFESSLHEAETEADARSSAPGSFA